MAKRVVLRFVNAQYADEGQRLLASAASAGDLPSAPPLSLRHLGARLVLSLPEEHLAACREAFGQLVPHLTGLLQVNWPPTHSEAATVGAGDPAAATLGLPPDWEDSRHVRAACDVPAAKALNDWWRAVSKRQP